MEVFVISWCLCWVFFGFLCVVVVFGVFFGFFGWESVLSGGWVFFFFFFFFLGGWGVVGGGVRPFVVLLLKYLYIYIYSRIGAIANFC